MRTMQNIVVYFSSPLCHLVFQVAVTKLFGVVLKLFLTLIITHQLWSKGYVPSILFSERSRCRVCSRLCLVCRGVFGFVIRCLFSLFDRIERRNELKAMCGISAYLLIRGV